MLSPAVRAAAAHFATSQLGTATIKAVELGYLTGYTNGYLAPKAERVDFPLGGQTDLHRLFGAYLGEGIDVYHPHSKRYGKLKGLPFREWHEAGPVADVEFYADAEAREEGCGDLTEPVSRLLPVLYDWEHLGSEMPSPTGATIVPAHELARQFCAVDEVDRLYYREQWDTLTAAYYPDVLIVRWTVQEWSQFNPGDEFEQGDNIYCCLKIHKDWSACEETEEGFIGIPVAYINYLRSLHFAVGLSPDQYHRRQPGFDYASGAKPAACLNCQGCEKGKEVCGA